VEEVDEAQLRLKPQRSLALRNQRRVEEVDEAQLRLKLGKTLDLIMICFVEEVDEAQLRLKLGIGFPVSDPLYSGRGG